MVQKMTGAALPASDEASASQKNSLDKLNLSDEEVGRFEKAFKDDEFMRLFEEYAKDIQDPATRAETNAYLQQLEGSGQLEQAYGAGTQLITPEPAFVVKTTQMSQPHCKVFINVCSSPKVRRSPSADKRMLRQALKSQCH